MRDRRLRKPTKRPFVHDRPGRAITPRLKWPRRYGGRIKSRSTAPFFRAGRAWPPAIVEDHIADATPQRRAGKGQRGLARDCWIVRLEPRLPTERRAWQSSCTKHEFAGNRGRQAKSVDAGAMRVMGRVCATVVLLVGGGSVLYGGQDVRTVQRFAVREIGRAPMQLELDASRATVVVFVSAVCPISAAYGERFAKLHKGYSDREVRLILVNSNQNESDTEVDEQRKASLLPFQVYRDPNGQLAELLQAYATPTAVVLDQSGTVRYFGSFDDARDPTRVTKQYVKLAIDAVLAGKAVELPRTKVLGCFIKGSPAR
jgi:AhpC/TSA family protein